MTVLSSCIYNTTTHLVDHPSSCRDGPESPRGGQEVVEAHAAQKALDAAAESEDHHMLCMGGTEREVNEGHYTCTGAFPYNR